MKRGVYAALTVALSAALLIAPGVAGGRAAADIDVLSWTWYRGDLGWYEVVGEAKNVGDGCAGFLKFVATWYSEDGEVVGTDYSYSILDEVRPGEKTPFYIVLAEDNVIATKVRLQWEWNECYEPPPRDVRLLSIHARYDGDLECLSVFGEVRNEGNHTADFVKVILTLYDSEGEVVAVDFTYTTLDELRPGQTSPFETYVCDRAREVDTYSWTVQHH